MGFVGGNFSVEGPLDAAGLSETSGRIGRGSQAGGGFAESRESRGAQQSRLSSLSRGARHASFSGFAIHSMARDARETWNGEWEICLERGK